MYKIGEFSILSKTTIKALRYYEKVGLLAPSFVDENNYRYYETDKLLEINHIISLKQIGFSLREIKAIMKGSNYAAMLKEKRELLKKQIREDNFKISKIDYLLKGEQISMKNEIIIKELPECIVYFKEGIVDDYSCLTEFILKSGEECLSTNPQIKCVQPDYCFIEYLDGEFKEENIKVRYSQAVTSFGVANETIRFKKINSTKAVCMYHHGPFTSLSETYGEIIRYIQGNNLHISNCPRECYIDGPWNKENENDYLTEIQFPIE